MPFRRPQVQVAPIRLVNPLHQAQLFEHIQGSVNSYQSQPGMIFPAQIENFDRFKGVAAVGHGVDDRPAWGSDAAAAGLQLF